MSSEETGGVALVTGAAGGIGSAITAALVAAGHRVAGLDRDEGQVTGDGVLALGADVTHAATVEDAVERAERELGPLTALVCAAGTLRSGSVFDTGDDDWHACLGVNAFGVFTVCRAVGARMAGRGRGSIVTIASNAAGVPRSDLAAYAASKAAATAFTRSLGLELAPRGVRANVVCPGSVDTPMLRAMWPDGQDGPAVVPAHAEALIGGSPERYRLGIPLGRVADPADVTGAVLFLLSDAARHVTLQTLYVDGGAALGP